jgi:hypothetical protein
LTGEVKKFATITPGKVFLKGAVGEKISQIITIVPEIEEPFAIIKVVPLKGSDFRYSLEEIELDGEKAYRLTIENTKESEGRYYDKLTFITDRSDYIPLSIVVSGDIRQVPSDKNETIKIQP